MLFANPAKHRLPVWLEICDTSDSLGIVHPRDELLGIRVGLSLFLDFREQGTLIGYAKFLLRFSVGYIVYDLAVFVIVSNWKYVGRPRDVRVLALLKLIRFSFGIKRATCL